MLRINASRTLLIAACAVGAGVAFGPAAAAEPTDPCQNSGSATVCETPGNTNVITDTPANPNGPGPQNGSYGPSGDTPPVGHDH